MRKLKVYSLPQGYRITDEVDAIEFNKLLIGLGLIYNAGVV